jgi:hypothetical protein
VSPHHHPGGSQRRSARSRSRCAPRYRDKNFRIARSRSSISDSPTTIAISWRARVSERARGFFDRVGGYTRDELRMGGIWYRDRKSQLRRSAAQEFIEGGKCGYPPVYRLWRPAVLPHVILEGLDIKDRGAQPGGVARPDKPAGLHKGHHIAAVSPACVLGFAPADPGLEDGCDRMEEVLSEVAIKRREWRIIPAITRRF